MRLFLVQPPDGSGMASAEPRADEDCSEHPPRDVHHRVSWEPDHHSAAAHGNACSPSAEVMPSRRKQVLSVLQSVPDGRQATSNRLSLPHMVAAASAIRRTAVHTLARGGP